MPSADGKWHHSWKGDKLLFNLFVTTWPANPDRRYLHSYAASHWIDVTVFVVRMFPFTPNSIVSSPLIGQPAKTKVQVGTEQGSSASTCNSSTSRCSGGWGIIASSCRGDAASVKTLSSQKQNNVHDDVFVSQRDHSGYVYSAHSIAESHGNDECDTVLGQRSRSGRHVNRSTSERYSGDMHWAAQSQALPSRSSGTFSLSNSARLCQSCGTCVTNSVSHYGSQESLSFGEFRRSTDVYSTICSVFWKMSLSFHPYVSSAHNQSSNCVEFSSLWPTSRGLTCLLPEICASLQGSIEALCRIAIFADVVKLLNALIDLRIVGKLFLLLLQIYVVLKCLYKVTFTYHIGWMCRLIVIVKCLLVAFVEISVVKSWHIWASHSHRCFWLTSMIVIVFAYR